MIAIIMAIIVTILVLSMALGGKNEESKLKALITQSKKYMSIIIIFTITSSIIFILLYNVDYINNIVSKNSRPIYDIVVLILLSMSISILLDGLFIIPIVQSLYEKIMINKIEKEYSHENLQYYRDIIKNISPAVLSYCYNKKINIEDEIISILLDLQMKKIIKIEGNNLSIIGDISKLPKHETFVLENINLIYNNTLLQKLFVNILLNDMKEEQYIYEENESGMNITYIMEYFMVWMIIYALVTIPVFMSASSFGIWVFLAYFLTFVGIPIYKSIQSKINPIVRKDKAIELSGKLKGLKNYIKDFSSIKDYGIESINLYDEYVIYAIIFDIKGKLNDECKRIYKNTKNMIVNSAKHKSY